MKNFPLSFILFVTFCEKLYKDELTDPKSLKDIILKVVKMLNNRIPTITSLAESKPSILTHLFMLVKEMLKLPDWQSIHLRKACKLYFNTKKYRNKQCPLCNKCLVCLLPVSMERTLQCFQPVCHFPVQRKKQIIEVWLFSTANCLQAYFRTMTTQVGKKYQTPPNSSHQP